MRKVNNKPMFIFLFTLVGMSTLITLTTPVNLVGGVFTRESKVLPEKSLLGLDGLLHYKLALITNFAGLLILAIYALYHVYLAFSEWLRINTEERGQLK